MDSTQITAPSKLKQNGIEIDENETGHQNGVESSENTEERVDRMSRITLRESRVSKKPDTQRIRQDLNALRERLSSGVTEVPRSENDSPVAETQREAMVGNLHLVFISDTEIRYTNKEATNTPDEDAGSVKVTVGYKTFEIHKSVLAQMSDYFLEKFKEEPEMNAIDVSSKVAANGFTLILDFLYDGTGVLSPRIGEIVCDTAASLNIKWLKEAAADYLSRQVQPNNYKSIYDLFEKHKMDVECGNVIRTVALNLVEFSDDGNFLRTLQYDLLKKILSENYYIDGSEGFVVKIVLDWVQVDVARDERLSFLMKLVRFPLLEPEELLCLPECVTKIPGFKQEIDSAMEYVCNVAAQYTYTDDKYLSRGYREVMVLQSATESNNCRVAMYKDLDKMDEPTCLENIRPHGLQTMLVYTSQTTLGNFIYAAGGLNEEYTITGRMFRYDARVRDWQELATMTTNRMAFAMVAAEDAIFAVAGESQTESGHETVLNSAEVYDARNNTWSAIAPLPVQCIDCAGAYFDGTIYIGGGLDSKHQDSRLLDDFYAYEITNQTWVKLTSLPRPRVGHSLSVVDGHIYVIGGKMSYESGTYVDCLHVDVYDITGRTWKVNESLPEGMGDINKHVAVLGDIIGFLAESRWRLYNTKTGEITVGEYCGSHVRRVSRLKVGYPPTEVL